MLKSVCACLCCSCRQIIATAVKGKRYGEAVELQMRFGTWCERLEMRSSQCKCYLGEYQSVRLPEEAEEPWCSTTKSTGVAMICAGAIVTHLYAKEPKEAWMLFQVGLSY